MLSFIVTLYKYPSEFPCHRLVANHCIQNKLIFVCGILIIATADTKSQLPDWQCAVWPKNSPVL